MSQAKLPAYPLFPIDPGCSLWSFTEELYASDVCSWTGEEKPIFGNINVDGNLKRFMGTKGAKDVIGQKGVKTSMTGTEYVFEDEAVRLRLRFTVPAYPSDRPPLPVGFVDVLVEALDDKTHQVEVLFDFSEKLTYASPARNWTMGGVLPFQSGKVGWIGRFYQFPLWSAGDKRDAAWGWFYLAGEADIMVTGLPAMRRYFRKLELKEKDNYRKLLAAHRKATVAPGESVQFFLTFAYDDLYSFNYFGVSCKGTWKNDYYDMVHAMQDVVVHHDRILRRAREFDRQAAKECAEFGEQYLRLVLAAYRHVNTCGKEGLRGDDRVFATKSSAQGGYAAALDQLYRGAPFYLYYFAERFKECLLPLFDYARMKSWPFEFAPADAGLYPFVTGQAQGLKAGYLKTTRKLLKPHPYQHYRVNIYKEDEMKPFANCARMLILSYAYFLETYDYQFVRENADLLSKWGDFLANRWDERADGDDADEGIRRALGLACWGKLLDEIQPGEGAPYSQKAHLAAAQVERVASPGEGMLHHVRDRRSWSLKTDLVWDDALSLGLFSPACKQSEYRSYLARWMKYGVPLHSETERATPDALLWAMAAGDLVEGTRLAAQALEPVFEKAASHGVPGAYDVVTGEGSEYFAASVAGVFMPLYLKHRKQAHE